MQATLCPGQETCLKSKSVRYPREDQSIETSLRAGNVRHSIDVVARDDVHRRGQRPEVSGAGYLPPCHIRACCSIQLHNGQSC